MKLKAIVTCVWDVNSLEDYNATTIEEAADNEQRRIDVGDYDLEDLVCNSDEITIKILPE